MPGHAILRTAGGVTAIASHTVREALRMKVLAVPAAFAATAAAAGPFLPTDGTPSGAVRVAVVASLAAASAFGTFAAIMLASLIYHRESRDRTSWLLVTKPVPRWALFAGRSLGLAGVSVVLFAGMALLSWLFARYASARELSRNPSASAELEESFAVRDCLGPSWETGPARAPQVGPAGPVELAPSSRVAWRFALPPSRPRGGVLRGRLALGEAVRGLVLAATNPETGARAELPLRQGPRGLVFELPEELVAFGDRAGTSPALVELELENRSGAPVRLDGTPPIAILAGSQAVVRPGGSYLWVFGIGGRPEKPAFRLRVSRAQPATQEAELVIRLAGRESSRRLTLERKPAMLVAAAELEGWGGGEVELELRNLSDTDLRLPAEGSLEFAPRAGTFAGALVRWAILESAKASFLVLVTCAGATVLSFPTSALLGGAFAVGGYLVAFVSSIITSGGSQGGAAGALALFFRALLPDLAGASAAGRVADGLLVPAAFVAWCLGALIFVRGGIAFAAGVVLAGRREYGE